MSDAMLCRKKAEKSISDDPRWQKYGLIATKASIGRTSGADVLQQSVWRRERSLGVGGANCVEEHPPAA